MLIHLRRITFYRRWSIQNRDNFVVDFIDDTCAKLAFNVIGLCHVPQFDRYLQVFLFNCLFAINHLLSIMYAVYSSSDLLASCLAVLATRIQRRFSLGRQANRPS